ncbi:hypothetical protein Hanom_Chr09g00812551 [Helianthus anomalus]
MKAGRNLSKAQIRNPNVMKLVMINRLHVVCWKFLGRVQIPISLRRTATAMGRLGGI